MIYVSPSIRGGQKIANSNRVWYGECVKFLIIIPMESPKIDEEPKDEEATQQPDRRREIPDTMPTAASIRYPIPPKISDTTPERDKLLRQIKERSQDTRNSTIPGPELPSFVNKASDEPKEEQSSLLSRFLKLFRGK